MDASNVVNLYTSKYVALQAINCGLREAVSLKGDTQKGLCNWKFNVIKLQIESTVQLFAFILNSSIVVNDVTSK